MKKSGMLLLLLCFLTGCKGAESEMEQAMMLRSEVLKAQSCSFDAQVTADYGDKLYVFDMSCETAGNGDLSFTVTKPDTIAGITGQVTETGGKLTFDDTVLHFDAMADDQVSPVTAPWILMRTLRGGCITAAGMEERSLRLSIDDSYEEDPLRLDIWLNSDNLPYIAEILYDGRRILSLDVKNFHIS